MKEGNSKSNKKNKEANSGKSVTYKRGASYKSDGKSIKSKQTSAAKTSIGEGSGRAAKSTGGSKLKSSQAVKSSNGLSKNVGPASTMNDKSGGPSKREGAQTALNSKNKDMSVTSGKSSGSGTQKSTSAKSGCSKTMPTTSKSVNGKSCQSKSAKSHDATGSKANTVSSNCGKPIKTKATKTKVLLKTKVKENKLSTEAMPSSTTPGKSISSSSKSSSVAVEMSHNSKRSEKKGSKRDSWLYRCLDEYDHGGQSSTFEPFFLTETIVIKHSQSQLDKMIDIDAALCDSAQMQWQQQAPTQTPPPTRIIKSTSHAVPNGPSVVSAPPPKMTLAKKMATGGVNKFEHVAEIVKTKVEEKQTIPTADRKRRNDRRAEQNRSPESENLLVPGVGILERAQRATLTRLNHKVMQAKHTKLTTLQEQNATRSRPLLPASHATILSEPFNLLSPITELLGLTGYGGIIKERFDQFGRLVGCVVNVTYETPLLQVNGIESFRIPVEDDPKEQLSMYFDEVLEKMYSFESKGLATVVHCMAGVSRSASFVIAYLMRYHQKSLEEAFRHTKAARKVINPNLGFLEQLERFESVNCNRTAEQCTQWRDHTLNEQTRRLPLFIITDYLEEYTHLFDAPNQ